jgi:hypothetical protein
MMSDPSGIGRRGGDHLDTSAAPGEILTTDAERIFDAVWRTDFTAPGFCRVDLGPGVDSHDLRSLMLDLKERLSAISVARGDAPLAYRSLGRFDQQETTKFHLDGAPDRSLLMLGYEPSRVRSRLSLADYTRCAYDLGIEPRRFLDEFNPMYRKGEERLAPYATELPQHNERHCAILLINNSALPFAEDRRNPLGVLHKAEIPDRDESKRRIVNSIMLEVGGAEEVDEERLRAFVAAEEVSKKFYG